MSKLLYDVGEDEFYKIFWQKLELEKGDNQGAIDIFEKLSPTYDLFLGKTNNYVHKKLVDILSAQVQVSGTLNKDCSILDVGCGTGLVGRCLRESEFTGNFEGVDGSQGMIDQAIKLGNVYNKLYMEILKPDGHTSLPKHNYDVVIAGHAFFPNSLEADHIEMLFDFLNVGGLFVFSLRYDIVEVVNKMMTYVATIEDKLKRFTDEGKCECLVMLDDDTLSPRLEYEMLKESRPKTEFVHERFYCYQKL